MNTDFDRNGGGVRHGGFRMFQSIPVGGTDNPLDMGGIKAVYKIFFGQQICGGNSHRSYLMQAQQGKPEFIVALEDQHYSVASPNPLGSEEIGGLITVFGKIGEGKGVFFAFIVTP